MDSGQGLHAEVVVVEPTGSETLIVVKGGQNGREVYELPKAGVDYHPPKNNNGKYPEVSHWIVCKGAAPDKPADNHTTPSTDTPPPAHSPTPTTEPRPPTATNTHPATNEPKPSAEWPGSRLPGDPE